MRTLQSIDKMCQSRRTNAPGPQLRNHCCWPNHGGLPRHYGQYENPPIQNLTRRRTRRHPSRRCPSLPGSRDLHRPEHPPSHQFPKSNVHTDLSQGGDCYRRASVRTQNSGSVGFPVHDQCQSVQSEHAAPADGDSGRGRGGVGNGTNVCTVRESRNGIESIGGIVWREGCRGRTGDERGFGIGGCHLFVERDGIPSRYDSSARR
mmetsp:Transcript_9850/g.9950  ORF Transcript_9850/g.9950 Transcript_9850/m.9950 type:complete len:205 (-) Transcript_9850:876-1490(-)